MEIEDEVVNEFNKQARMIELEREKAEREQQRAEKERQKAKKERQKAEEEKRKAEKEKQAKNNLIKKLASMQMSNKEIAEAAGIKEEEVARLLKQQ